MPVITFSNSKGGAGKSTSSLTLALTLAKHYTVTIFDCDKNKTLSRWYAHCKDSGVEVVADINEKNIVAKLNEYRLTRQFVICDLEGARSAMMSSAMARSQLVIIPLQASTPDADQAVDALDLVRSVEEDREIQIQHRVLLTRTAHHPNFKTTIQKEIEAELLEGEVPMLATQLADRPAYKGILHYKTTFEGLREKPVNTLDQAIKEANNFRKEVLDLITQTQKAAA